ncbi:MAG: hypothetical protein ACRDSG_11675 [Pseudonocardiaceae bacterium]
MLPRRRPDGPRREEQVRAQRGDPLELDTVGFAQHLGQGGTAKLVPRPRVAGAGVFAKPLRRADRCDPECQQGVCSTSPTVTTRLGWAGISLLPYLWSIVTGKPPSPEPDGTDVSSSLRPYHPSARVITHGRRMELTCCPVSARGFVEGARLVLGEQELEFCSGPEGGCIPV